ncbi:MAG: HAMP domain-containing sensor histidine kinase [Bacteroidota bacterium]
MNLRSKFLLVLTLVISAILALSFGSVYFLYEHSKDTDEKKFLLAEANEASFLYFRLHKNALLEDSVEANEPKDFAGNKAISIIIFNTQKKLVFSYPDTAIHNLRNIILDSIREDSPYYFENGESLSVGLFYRQGKDYCYTIVSVNTYFEESQRAQLKNILIMVALASIIFIVLFSFYYVFIVTAPLVKLSIQMRHISVSDLKKRVEVVKGNFKNNEIVQVATNMNGMLDRLERAFENQKNFVRHASHELRTPLANMLLQTDYALEKDLDKNEYLRILQSLKEDELELISLINTLLQFSQYEQIDNLQLSPLTRLDDVVYNCISFAKKSYPGIHINFEFATTPESEDAILVNGHPELLRVAFNNLIKNAYNYSPDKKIDIVLDTNDKGVNIIFENAGKGLKKDEAEKLFLPFFRGENKNTTKGFGLGLAIVEKIIKIHHAKITYQFTGENKNRFVIFFSKGKKNPGKDQDK